VHKARVMTHRQNDRQAKRVQQQVGFLFVFVSFCFVVDLLLVVLRRTPHTVFTTRKKTEVTPDPWVVLVVVCEHITTSAHGLGGESLE